MLFRSYGLLRRSGNEAAIAIAEGISGDVDTFVALMNTEANALGASNSHFVTPNGLRDEDHYTTVYDMYLIMNAAVQNETFVDTILPNMISSATKIAKGMGENEITKGLQRMKLTLNHEIDRLTALQKRNKHIRPDEIQTAIEERSALSTMINNARVRLDAMQLIRKE